MQKIVALENRKISLHDPYVQHSIRFVCDHFEEQEGKIFMIMPTGCNELQCKTEDRMKISILYENWRTFKTLVKEHRALVRIEDREYYFGEIENLYFVEDVQVLGDKQDTVELSCLKVDQLELLGKLSNESKM